MKALSRAERKHAARDLAKMIQPLAKPIAILAMLPDGKVSVISRAPQKVQLEMFEALARALREKVGERRILTVEEAVR